MVAQLRIYSKLLNCMMQELHVTWHINGISVNMHTHTPHTGMYTNMYREEEVIVHWRVLNGRMT